ncbi:MAG: Ig-like domain-containing protein [Eubacterium sp.]|nr:Ig-like domain-containing protein [Eubacterium sp.]
MKKASIKLSWKKPAGAAKFVIYANACGKGKKYQKLATTIGKSKTIKKVAGAKLKNGKYYKFLLVALDANNKVVSTSKTVHVATAGGKVGNNKAVTTKAKKNKVTIKVGKTFKLAAKTVPASKKLKVKKHRNVMYETSNKAIATVSKKGVIKGVKKGTCFVYAYAQNGVFKKIKVTVK